MENSYHVGRSRLVINQVGIRSPSNAVLPHIDSIPAPNRQHLVPNDCLLSGHLVVPPKGSTLATVTHDQSRSESCHLASFPISVHFSICRRVGYQTNTQAHNGDTTLTVEACEPAYNHCGLVLCIVNFCYIDNCFEGAERWVGLVG
ncbi:unnamed protein product [Protopolystoma xenopodis]|uniref:Uncharacterized protein n=1 Tax=Protopolystoma xenopodis TaxID=117903 RepID=A0A3S5BSH8_9PLAT|nr:unnamed protein product [Protopolystoma xenopodis]